MLPPCFFAQVNMTHDSFLLDSYDYELPEELIAQFPPERRGSSRLLVLDRNGNGPCDAMFLDLPAYLPEGTVLVANNSRVVPARLFGTRPSGGKAELLLLTPPPLAEKAAHSEGDGWASAPVEALLRPGRSICPGDRLRFGPYIEAEVEAKHDFGRHDIRLFWQGSLISRMEESGRLPLPPYIRREQGPDDRARYQTLYARSDKAGSVAAPTAGLHFTEAMRARLAEAGVPWVEVTLHVGYGTFSPVREHDIREHPMHREYVEVSADAARIVNEARRRGRPVVAVGTTSARTLEGVVRACGHLPDQGWQGWTDIFIYPGFRFQVVDGLLTNFHLPKSSLIMLVSALAGREAVLDAYAHAVREKYRFFSYGDAMLVR